MKLHNKRILIIGGSSGIGFATALASLEEGAEVTIASRSIDKLNKAKDKLSGKVDIKQVDLCDEETLKSLFVDMGEFDHLQLPGSDMRTGPFLQFPQQEAELSFVSKFWGPYKAAKFAYPFINKNEGSITFYSGSYSQRPVIKGAAVAAAINSAIEGLGRALASELAPVRVNVISPGLTMTERFTKNYPSDELKKICRNFQQHLIIKRSAKPDEIAHSAIYLMTNDYATGVTLFLDGGFSLR